MSFKQLNRGNSTPPLSGSPCSVTGNYAFEYVPNGKINSLTSLHDERIYVSDKTPPFLDKTAKNSSFSTGVMEYNIPYAKNRFDEVSGNSGLSNFMTSSSGFLDLFGTAEVLTGLHNDSNFPQHSKKPNTASDSFSTYVGSGKNLLDNIDGSGIFSTLGITENDTTGDLNEDYCLTSLTDSAIMHQDSAYLALMGDNELMGVLQDWSMGADNVENDLLFGLTEPSGDGSVRGRQTPALQA
jgi:hypothetical protein